MARTVEEYHRAELAIALDPTDPRRAVPERVGAADLVLDIGCGVGQTLAAVCPGRRSVGIDIDEEALRLGRTLLPAVDHVNGRAESLPFRRASFDFVLSRVSLPYTDIRASLAEIRRVLRPGGRFWATLHTIEIAARPIRLAQPKSLVWFAYILANSASLHWTGRTFPFINGRRESFQTAKGIERELRRAGFVDVRVDRGHHFTVTARLGQSKAVSAGAGAR